MRELETWELMSLYASQMERALETRVTLIGKGELRQIHATDLYYCSGSELARLALKVATTREIALRDMGARIWAEKIALDIRVKVASLMKNG